MIALQKSVVNIMAVFQFLISLLLVMLLLSEPVFATEHDTESQCTEDDGGGCIMYPQLPGVEITIAPSLWYGFVDRSGPLFKNDAARSVGLQTARLSGPIGGFTVTVNPNWSSGFAADLLFNFSAYYAKENGNFSTVYYKTVTNDENNNWQGAGHENRQDYEVLVLKELLPTDESAGSSSASALALGGVRYIDIETSVLGQDIFQNQLTYNRHNKFFLGEAGFRFTAPLADGWRLMLGGTGLYGTTYDQNGEVCGCGQIERDSRSTRADGYDVYGGISVIPHEINEKIPEGISVTLRYRDRSLYTEEQGVTGIDHQYGPEITFAWQLPVGHGEQ